MESVNRFGNKIRQKKTKPSIAKWQWLDMEFRANRLWKKMKKIIPFPLRHHHRHRIAQVSIFICFIQICWHFPFTYIHTYTQHLLTTQTNKQPHIVFYHHHLFWIFNNKNEFKNIILACLRNNKMRGCVGNLVIEFLSGQGWWTPFRLANW